MMKGISYMLAAAVVLSGVIVYVAHASVQAGGEASPIFGIKIPRGTWLRFASPTL
jgi:hypothetical protein